MPQDILPVDPEEVKRKMRMAWIEQKYGAPELRPSTKDLARMIQSQIDMLFQPGHSNVSSLSDLQLRRREVEAKISEQAKKVIDSRWADIPGNEDADAEYNEANQKFGSRYLTERAEFLEERRQFRLKAAKDKESNEKK